MLYAHLLILLGTVLVIFYTDHLAFRYLVGNIPVLDERRMRRLHYTVGAGLIGMILTGVWMAYPALGALWALPMFKLKLAFVVLLVLNACNLGMALSLATKAPFKELVGYQKARLLVGGALSSVSWLGAIVSALLLFGNVGAWLGL